MTINNEMPEETLLQELGRRAARMRLAQNLTQQELAERAGISRRSIERLEAGASGARLPIFLAVCRVFRLLPKLELLLPADGPMPLEIVDNPKPEPKRAMGRRGKKQSAAWKWGDEK